MSANIVIKIEDVEDEYEDEEKKLPESAITPASPLSPRRQQGFFQEEGLDISRFDNKAGLADDLKFLASMPELCDVTFLVGEKKEPVCGVKAVLAARSRVFYKMLYEKQTQEVKKKDKKSKEDKEKSDRKSKDKDDRKIKDKTEDKKSSAARKFFRRRSSTETGIPPTVSSTVYNGNKTIVVDDFEPDVFRQLIEYVHTGSVTLQARTLLGLTNAADYFGLDELKKTCIGFVNCCINVDTACALLASAEEYMHYKSTRCLVQKVLEFVDTNGDHILSLPAFALLPQHVVKLVLSREELQADELTKFHAALLWCRKHCEKNTEVKVKDVMSNFLEQIAFHKIPAAVLMREVHPIGVIPDYIVMNALAYQADPASIDPAVLLPSVRTRRSHLTTQQSVQSLSRLRINDNMSLGASNSTISSTTSDESGAQSR